MKRFKHIILVLALMAMVPVIIQSCRKNEVQDIVNAEVQRNLPSIPKVLYGVKFGKLSLPDGTRVERIDASNIRLIFPRGIELWTVEDGTIVRRPDLEYTCDCSGGGGCTVFYAGKKHGFGCLHGKCDGNCTGHYGSRAEKQYDKAFFVNLNKDRIQSVHDVEQWNKMPYMPVALIRHPLVEKKLLDYARKIYGNKYMEVLKKIKRNPTTQSDINDILFVRMQLFGYKFVYATSVNDLKESVFKNNDFSKPVNFSCKCNQDDGNCTKDTFHGILFCEADCSSCTMTVKN